MTGVPFGLCATCRHAKLNPTRRGTVYLRCTRAAWDDRLTRYPELPVRRCPGYDHGEPDAPQAPDIADAR